MGRKPHHKDITGIKSGTLMAIKRVSFGLTRSKDYWLCSCDCGCGTSRIILAARITGTKLQYPLSCRKLRKHPEIKKGYRIGWLTVTKKAPDRIQKTKTGRLKRERMWYCRCDCGGRAIKADYSLKPTKYAKLTCGCGQLVGLQFAFSGGIDLEAIPLEDRRGFVDLCRLKVDVKKEYQKYIGG